jgi:hypothetical protein
MGHSVTHPLDCSDGTSLKLSIRTSFLIHLASDFFKKISIYVKGTIIIKRAANVGKYPLTTTNTETPLRCSLPRFYIRSQAYWATGWHPAKALEDLLGNRLAVDKEGGV